MDLHKEIETLINLALSEDVRTGDTTTLELVPETATISARLVMRQAGIIAGLPFLKMFFHKMNPQIEVKELVSEGSFQKAGTIIATISGPAQGILTAERSALNFLQHACGVATITAAYVKELAGLKCSIMDTRKTLPGLRALEKYAVRVGGGINHRFGLDDRLVIKKNHLSFLSLSSPHAINEAVQKIKEKCKGLPIEIEINDLSLLDRILETDVFAIMLSNMTLEDISKSVKKIKQAGKKVNVESCETITLETVRAYAETGVDGISISDITHSVKALHIGFRII